MAPQQPARSKSSRKRRRRQASYSPSASSSGGSDSEAASSQAGPSTLPAQILPAASANKIPPSDSDDSESSDDSDEDEEMPSESQSDDESESTISSSSTASQPAKTFPAQPDLPIPSKTSHMPRRMSDSPSPPPIQLPSFFAPRRSEEDDERRLRFRRLYMDKLVQGFSGDLEALRAVSTGYESLCIAKYGSVRADALWPKAAASNRFTSLGHRHLPRCASRPR
ncbi:hypothetical protein BD324DRAFT_37005 [Kockovaella imperatae]|uniref:Ribosome assembly protein 3 n=1 Tax=Kockovaella imperatae TaxID=4999 RepID=A0A1Y1UU45_9TREE|nr:hypothetical protein BD324DRAFT_37005 [Kockovaella imperatae]ORX41074.1 hypothetical protein BD324DRAFT_37005 [Kockovaella imperatae]